MPVARRKTRFVHLYFGGSGQQISGILKGVVPVGFYCRLHENNCPPVGLRVDAKEKAGVGLTLYMDLLFAEILGLEWLEEIPGPRIFGMRRETPCKDAGERDKDCATKCARAGGGQG